MGNGNDSLNLNLLPQYNCYNWKLVKIEPIENLELYKDHNRLKVFYQKGVTCALCGKVHGSYIGHYQQCNGKSSGEIHIDVYSEDGIMMNRDHIKPKSKGGRNDLSNLQPTCEPCNSAKGNGDSDEERKSRMEKAYQNNKKNFKVGDFVKYKDPELARDNKYLYKVISLAPKSSIILEGYNGNNFKMPKSKFNRYKFQLGELVRLKNHYNKRNLDITFEVIGYDEENLLSMNLKLKDNDGKVFLKEQDKLKSVIES